MNLNFRIATLDDTIEICELVNSAYRGEFSKNGWTNETHLFDGQRTDAKEIEDIISDKSQVFILCLHDDAIIGTVVVKNKSDCAYVGMVSIRPDLQRSGLGKQLLIAAEELAINQWNLPKIEMTVIKQRPELINWYERRGYFFSGEKRPFPYGNPRVGAPKVNDLEFVVLNKAIKPKMRCRL